MPFIGPDFARVIHTGTPSTRINPWTCYPARAFGTRTSTLQREETPAHPPTPAVQDCREATGAADNPCTAGNPHGLHSGPHQRAERG